jgi:hypothetical protein
MHPIYSLRSAIGEDSKFKPHFLDIDQVWLLWIFSTATASSLNLEFIANTENYQEQKQCTKYAFKR